MKVLNPPNTYVNNSGVCVRRLLLIQQSFLVIAATMLLVADASGQPDSSSARSTVNAAAKIDASGGVGLRFRENRGQIIDSRRNTRPDILYTANDRGMRLFLRRDAISYVFTHWVPDTTPR